MRVVILDEPIHEDDRTHLGLDGLEHQNNKLHQPTTDNERLFLLQQLDQKLRSGEPLSEHTLRFALAMLQGAITSTLDSDGGRVILLPKKRGAKQRLSPNEIEDIYRISEVFRPEEIEDIFGLSPDRVRHARYEAQKILKKGGPRSQNLKNGADQLREWAIAGVTVRHRVSFRRNKRCFTYKFSDSQVRALIKKELIKQGGLI